MPAPDSQLQPSSMGAISTNARAVQEVQAALVVAKHYPRDVRRSIEAIVTSCGRPRLAEQALYQYAKGGTDISGPSVRLAEAIAQHWGNVEFGFRELDRGSEDGVGWSDVQCFAWDLESNSRRVLNFRVRHWRDTRKGGYKIEDEREIYELIANMAQRRVRACILAIIPGDIVDEAVHACEATLAAKADTSPESVKRLLDAFKAVGVTRQQIEARIQRNVESITAGQVVQLKKVWRSLSDGMSQPSDWFDHQDSATGQAPTNIIDPFAGNDAAPEPEAPQQHRVPTEDDDDLF